LRVAAAALLALLVPFEGRPAERAAEATLALVRKAYSSTGSVSCVFVQTYAPAGFTETAPETGRLVLQAPDRVRFDYDGPEGKVFTFDGTAGRQYVAADKQMVVKRLAPGDRERLPLVFLESTDALLARYDATEKPAENGLVELALAPKKPGSLKSLALLVVPVSGEVKRLVLVDASGNRTSFTFTQKTSGKSRPDSDFTLVPPEGTKVLTE
jgi:outer membrane lipoprotein carrier protein